MDLERIGKYEVISTIGRGSMGLVYKAQDPEIGRLVAIKTLRSIPTGGNLRDQEMLERFRIEARSAGKLRHPNIVTVFETGKTDEGVPFIVMDYIEGDSLDVVIKRNGKLDPIEAIHYTAQLAAAIDYAHAHKVYHRDIKPSNVIVSRNYCPHLLDFGVAKVSDTSLTPVGTVVGTPSYMSPEQIRGIDEGGGTDLFALSVMTFEMLTGSRPFPGKDFVSVVANIIHRDPTPFKELNVTLPLKLEEVLAKGLAKKKEDRYQQAMEFAAQAAAAFGIPIDVSGIAGGFRIGLKVEDFAQKTQVTTTNRIHREHKSSSPLHERTTMIFNRDQDELHSTTLNNSDEISEEEVDSTSSAVKIVEGLPPNIEFGQPLDHSHLTKIASVVGVLMVSFSIGVLYINPSLPNLPLMNDTVKEQFSSDAPTTTPPVEGIVNSNISTPKSPDNPPLPQVELAKGNSATEIEMKIPPNQKNPILDRYTQLLQAAGPSVSEMKEIMNYAKSNNNKDLALALAKWAQTSSFNNRVQVLRVFEEDIQKSGDFVLIGLELFLQDSDSLIRAKAAKTVGTLHNERSMNLLLDRLGKEKDPLVLQMIQDGLVRK